MGWISSNRSRFILLKTLLKNFSRPRNQWAQSSGRYILWWRLPANNPYGKKGNFTNVIPLFWFSTGTQRLIINLFSVYQMMIDILLVSIHNVHNKSFLLVGGPSQMSRDKITPLSHLGNFDLGLQPDNLGRWPTPYARGKSEKKLIN